MKRNRFDFIFLGIIFFIATVFVINTRDFFSIKNAFSYEKKSGSSEINEFLPQESNIQDDESLNFSLRDVIELALQDSLDIQIAKFNVYISRTSLNDAVSIFDSFLNLSTDFTKNKKMSASISSGNENIEKNYSMGIEKKTSTGTNISFDLTESKNKSDSGLNTLNPYHESLGEISIVQSLGKNFFGVADRSKIKVTKIDIENSEFTSLDDIEDVLYKVEKAYWKLVLMSEKLFIQEDMLAEGQKLYEIYKDKHSLGLAELTDLLAIEALIYAYQSNVDIANLERVTAKNDLLFLINNSDFRKNINVKDDLACLVNKVDLDHALIKAVNSRRDYKRIKNILKKNDIEIVVKKNALWPEIDLEASLTKNNIDSKFRSSWEELGERNNDELFFKLTVKVPLENNKAKADLDKINFQKSRALIDFKRIEIDILQDINNKVNRVNTMENQVNLFKSIVAVHKKKLDIEIKRLNSGRSNSDTLIRYEEDLLNARLSLANSLFNYRISNLDLELAQNLLLDKYWKGEL